MTSEPCSVSFTVITPEDLDVTPYVLLHVRGMHSHLPPLPTKVLSQIRKVVYKLMVQSDRFNLSRGMLFLIA